MTHNHDHHHPSKEETMNAIRTLLSYIGEDVSREGILETPARVVKAYTELTEGYHAIPSEILAKTFDVKADEMVMVKDIHYWSLCEHHMLPFHGHATVAYLPRERVVGLSKIPRVVEAFSRRLQVQERLTNQIAETINKELDPLGVAVLMEGHHLCCSMRGAKKPVTMKTSKLIGKFKTEQEVRNEFLMLAKG